MIQPRHKRAFTLVEVVAVLVIAGLLAAAGVRLSGAAARARGRIETVVVAIEQVDRLARLEAVRSGRGQMIVVEAEYSRVSAAHADGARPWGRPLELPDTVRIAAVRVAGGGVASGGKFSIPVAANGSTACYALRLAQPEDDQRSRWLVFIGITGRTLEVSNEREVDGILNPRPQPLPSDRSPRDDGPGGRGRPGHRRLRTDSAAGGEGPL